MSQLKRNQFQLTILAMAVLSLSACSTTSNTGGFDFGSIGTGIGKIGSKTAELGSSAWEGTKNVLNIGPQETELLDEVDLALMEDDAVINTAQPVVEQVQIGTAELKPVLPRNSLKPTNATPNGKLAFGQIPEPTTNEEVLVLAANDQEQPAMVSEEVQVASAGSGNAPLLDLTYEVKDDENLWKIAKNTTGDANNWHILADINNLAPNASVYPGQKLTIPADMVSPEYSGADQPLISDVAETAMPETTMPEATQSLTEQAALTQPVTPDNATEAVVAKVPEANTELAAVKLELPEAKPELVAAAATPVESAELTVDMSDALPLEVGAGETLWDFAKRTTGDATNWKAIADANTFDEQQLGRIRAGQKILVPANMLRARDENGALIAKGEENAVPNAQLGGVAPKNTQAIEASAAVLAGTNKSTDAPKAAAATEVMAAKAEATTEKVEAVEGDIKIVEAAFQDEGTIKPVTAESLSEEASQAVAANDAKMGKVMIKGTYYPKAVYNSADFSSTLLMRVSPGTQLLVSKAIGPWLEVKTDKGIGYVHSRDIK